MSTWYESRRTTSPGAHPSPLTLALTRALAPALTWYESRRTTSPGRISTRRTLRVTTSSIRSSTWGRR